MTLDLPRRRGWGALVAALLLISVAAMAKADGVDIQADVPGGSLKGTLTTPSAGLPRAVAVIIPGSGPTDRDGNNPLGARAAPYRLLAEALAARQVATVRVDKRGMFGSTGAFGDPNAASIADYAGDARAWALKAATVVGLPCAWLIGHSEGGLVATLAGLAEDPALCGLVLVASPGRPLGDVLRAQLRSNPANLPLMPDALRAISDLELGMRVDVSGFHPALQALFAPAVQGFLIDAFRHDPAELVRRVRKPVLIVQGGRDLQVGADDAERLALAQPAAGLLVLPGMNHVLKAVPDDQAANLASYADPDQPLAPGLAEAIADFMLDRR